MLSVILIILQVSRLSKAFANDSSANIKFSKSQLHEIGQSGGSLGRHLGPLIKTELPLIGYVLKPLANIISINSSSISSRRSIHKKCLDQDALRT